MQDKNNFQVNNLIPKYIDRKQIDETHSQPIRCEQSSPKFQDYKNKIQMLLEIQSGNSYKNILQNLNSTININPNQKFQQSSQKTLNHKRINFAKKLLFMGLFSSIILVLIVSCYSYQIIRNQISNQQILTQNYSNQKRNLAEKKLSKGKSQIHHSQKPFKNSQKQQIINLKINRDFQNIPVNEFDKKSQLITILQDQHYHIYPKLNCRLVLDVAKAGDGSHDLILYQWQSSINQNYLFEHVYGNFYYIKNAEFGQYMTKSQKKSQNLSQISFLPEKQKIWQVIPVNKEGQNAYYILSSDYKALNLFKAFTNNGDVVTLNEWDLSINQIWFIRKSKKWQSDQNSTKQNYQEKASSLLNKMSRNLDGLNDCMALNEITVEMKVKNISVPQWMQKPKVMKAENYLLPNKNILHQKSLSQSNPQLSLKSAKTNELPIVNSEKQEKKNFLEKQDSDNNINFKPNSVIQICAQNHIVAYIWYSDKQMPQEYKNLLIKCKNNTRLLTEKDLYFYVQKWNHLQPSYAVNIDECIIRQRINFLKLLYLYFESGIYADFDTEINEQCFGNVYSDEIIFTNRMDENVDYDVQFSIVQNVIPEENFMMIRRKDHPQVKRMIIQQILQQTNKGGKRWKECKFRQCLIIQCQRHYRDNTYKKGFV